MKDVRTEETEDSPLCSAPFFFRVERAIPITGQVSVHVLCSAGPRQQGARRTDQNLAAGKWPRKRRSLRSFPSFLHITSPLLLLFGVSSQSSCAGIPMFLADGQTSSLAPAQRKEKIGHANAKQWN